MKAIKFWTINSGLLNDEEFEEFVSDIEEYTEALTAQGPPAKQNCNQWMNNFVSGYIKWPKRQFDHFQHPVHNYFQVDAHLDSLPLNQI